MPNECSRFKFQIGVSGSLSWAIDELVAATCPGASYCKTASSPIPVVATLLGSPINDGVVTLDSQHSGCAGSCTTVTYNPLAHTSQRLGMVGFVLNDNNVINNEYVDLDIACVLSNQCRPQTRSAVQSTPTGGGKATSVVGSAMPSNNAPHVAPVKSAAQEQAEIAALPHIVYKIPSTLPNNIILGTPFRLKIAYARALTTGVSVRQMNEVGNSSFAERVPLEQSPDGQTYAVITPLVPGNVVFGINAGFEGNMLSVQNLYANVGNPVTPPLHFWADTDLARPRHADYLTWNVRDKERFLQPSIVWPTEPFKPVTLRHGATYSLGSSTDASVLKLTGGNMFKCLKAGSASIVVHYVGLTATAKIKCFGD